MRLSIHCIYIATIHSSSITQYMSSSWSIRPKKVDKMRKFLIIRLFILSASIYHCNFIIKVTHVIIIVTIPTNGCQQSKFIH